MIDSKITLFAVEILCATCFSGASRAQSSAQHMANESAESSPEIPIVVIGKDEDEKPKVITGSRLPRYPLFEGGSVATNTGVMGLVPGSGMDPMGQYTKNVRHRSCKSDDNGVSPRAACVLADANTAIGEGDIPLAFGLLKALEGDVDTSNYERFVASRLRYQVAMANEDRANMADALQVVIHSEVLPLGQKEAAQRQLAKLREGD